jgi:glutaminase
VVLKPGDRQQPSESTAEIMAMVKAKGATSAHGGPVDGAHKAPGEPHDPDTEEFAVAGCTVDGQQFCFGNAARRFPLMETIMPFIYAMALEDVSEAETRKWVAAEPSSLSPNTFLLKPAVKSTKRKPPAGERGVLWVWVVVGGWC